jgi:pescadillo protein
MKAKDKTYYHLKDIQFMQHEPLLAKYRELKTFLKKKNRLIARKEDSLVKSLPTPEIKIDHLVKERYPTFLDAVRDLDDALTMIFLFHTLRVRVHLDFVDSRAAMIERLVKEWKKLVQETSALRKVFVSIKGYYFQADIKGVPVTWLVPHKAVQNTPEDIDYFVMTTFLEFYEALVRCVNFKVYKEEKIVYPPTFTEDDEAKKVEAFFAEKKAVASKSTKAGGKKVSDATKLKAQKADEAEADEEEEKEDKSTSLESFHALDPSSLNLINEDEAKIAQLFKNEVFMIGREVPFDAVAFVIRSAGGVAFREDDLSSTQAQSAKITIQVADRPKLATVLPSRRYVQPQWVFDSFNERTVLPTQPYGIGEKLPPHLSPFVDDVREGYVPEQRNVLRQWVGLKPLKDSVIEKIEKTAEELEAEEKAREEAEHQKGLEIESKKLKRKAAEKDDVIEIEQDEEFGDDEDEEEDFEIVDEDDDDEEDIDLSSDDEEEEVIKKPAPAPRPAAFNPRDNERELAKIVMKKKDKRLLERMEFGMKRKQAKGEVLKTKKRAAEEGDENPTLPRAVKSRRLR